MAEQEKKSVAGMVGAVIAYLVTIAVCVVGGWIAREMIPQEKAMPPVPAAQAMTVAVVDVQEREYNRPNRYVAHAEAVQEVDLLPQVDGYIKEIKFKEGDVVKEGQLLYVIDDERYQAVVNQRKADLAAAEAEERRTKRYYDRMLKADARGITQLERDNAEAGWENAKAKVMQAKANLVVAEYDCKKTQVVAPIGGQIGKSSAHVGDYVAPSKGALSRIVQIDPIRVTFPLTDRAYIAWRAAQSEGKQDAYRMRLILADGSEYKQQGTWEFDDNQMSRETASIQMRLSFPNAERLLIPNSYVTLLVDNKVPPKVPSIPQQCVIDIPGGNQGVWVVKSDMTVEQRMVKAGENFNGWVPVTEGIAVGEKVVLSGVSKLAPGMQVVEVKPTDNEDINPDYQPAIKE